MRDSDTKLGGPPPRRIITTHQGAECPPYGRRSQDLAEREEKEEEAG